MLRGKGFYAGTECLRPLCCHLVRLGEKREKEGAEKRVHSTTMRMALVLLNAIILCNVLPTVAVNACDQTRGKLAVTPLFVTDGIIYMFEWRVDLYLIASNKNRT